MSDDDLLAIKQRLEEQLLDGPRGGAQGAPPGRRSASTWAARASRQSPKVRFRRALLAGHRARPPHGIQLERDEIATRLRDEFDELIDERADHLRLPADRESRRLPRARLRAARPRPAAQPAAPARRALRGRAPPRSACPSWTGCAASTAARASATLPAAVSALHQHRAHATSSSTRAQRPLRAGVHGGHADGAARRRPSSRSPRTASSTTSTRMRDVVARLRDQGFRIAIDDAGAGYSGLQTMVEIEPDFIKLDISLMRNIEISVVKQKLVRHAARLLREGRHHARRRGHRDRASSSMPCSSSGSATARASSSPTRDRRIPCGMSSRQLAERPAAPRRADGPAAG